MRTAGRMIVVVATLTSMLGACKGSGTEPTVTVTMEPLTSVFQYAQVGRTVSVAPAVILKDRNGAPMANKQVVFAVTAGGGQVTPATVTTGADGVAAATGWTLGSANAVNAVAVTVQGADPTKFFALASGGTPAQPLSARITGLTGRPFGVRGHSGNIAYVTRQDANLATRVDATAMSMSSSVPTGNDPAEIVFDESGTRGYVPDVLGHTIAIVNVSTNTLEQEVPVSGSPFRVAMLPNGQRVYVPMNNGQIAVLQTATRTLGAPITLSGALNGIAIDAAGQRLYVSSMFGNVFVVDAATGQTLTSRAVGGTPQEVVLSPDGTEVYVANESGWVDVLEASTLNSKAKVTAPGAFGMALSPDGARLWVSGAQVGLVSIIDRTKRRLTDVVNVTGMPRRVAFTAAAKALVANEFGWLDVLQ